MDDKSRPELTETCVSLLGCADSVQVKVPMTIGTLKKFLRAAEEIAADGICDENDRSKATRLEQDVQSLEELLEARDEQIAELNHANENYRSQTTRLTQDIDCLNDTVTELKSRTQKIGEFFITAEDHDHVVTNLKEKVRDLGGWKKLYERDSGSWPLDEIERLKASVAEWRTLAESKMKANIAAQEALRQ